ncbi:MAG: hypothetical protein AAGF36_16095 [Pseudomonadota bacterium]
MRDHQCEIVEVGKNSTDGKAVSTRSCLTGQRVAPYGHVLVDWISGDPAPNEMHGHWIQEDIS